MDEFIVTDAWLLLHRTFAGAWTRDQLDAIGVNWPPRAGWKQWVIGRRISISNKARFEAKLSRKEVKYHPTQATLL